MSLRDQFGPENLTRDGHAAKMRVRERTLQIIQESDFWVPDGDGFLNGDWVEMCGEGDETLKMLLSKGVLRPGYGKYIGVNNSPEVIATNRTLFAEEEAAGLVEWRLGDWAEVTSDFKNLSRVRVVVFDHFIALHNEQISNIIRDCTDLAEYLLGTNGAVLLMLNFSLYAQSRDPSRIQRYEKSLQVWKNEVCPSNRTPMESCTYTSKRIPMLPVWVPLGF